MNKDNKQLNTEHQDRELQRVRPEQPGYDFTPLEAVIRQWAQAVR